MSELEEIDKLRRCLADCIVDRKELRELNADLVAHIRDALDALRRDEPCEASRDLLAAIAKAEGRR